MRKIDNDPKNWSKDIQAFFYETYPFLSQYPIKIDLVKKDYEKGYAYGKITLNGILAIPVIVEDFILKDLDVALYNGKAIPFTKESISTLFSNPSAFKATFSIQKDDKLTKLFDPALKYPSDTYVKEATELIPVLLETLSKEAKERIQNTYSQRDIASFVCNKTAETLTKILTADPKDISLTSSISNNLPRDRQYIHKIARDKYRLFSGNSRVDDAIILDINEEEKSSFKNAFADKEEYPIDKKAELKIKPIELRPGVDGVISDGETHIKIAVSVDVTENESRHILGLNGLHPVRVTVIDNINKIVKLADSDYLVPKNFEFFELGLEPGKRQMDNKINGVYKDSSSRYTFQGPVFKKYAENNHQVYNLIEMDAKWVAIQCGACEEDVEKMAHAKKGQRYYFENSKLVCPESMENFSQKCAEYVEKNKVDLKPIHGKLHPVLKIAAKIDEQRVVDKILQLGLIDEKNMKFFVDRIPEFEIVNSYLAELLLAARIGERRIPEKEVQEAMEALASIIFYLRNIENTQKANKELKR